MSICRAIVWCVSAVLLVFGMSACGAKLVPPTVIVPRFPDFITPILAPPDPRLDALETANNTGWQFLQAGDLGQAEKSFQTLLKRSPSFYPSEAALGYVSLARKDYDPALEHFNHVLADRPDYVPALVGRGEAMLAQSKEPEALVDFERAQQLDPALSGIAVGYGQTYMMLRDFPHAEAQFERAIALSPDAVEPYFSRVMVALRGYGSTQRARAVLDEAGTGWVASWRGVRWTGSGPSASARPGHAPPRRAGPSRPATRWPRRRGPSSGSSRLSASR